LDSSPTPGLIAAAAYSGGRRVADIAIAEARAWSRREDHFVWIGLLEPGDALLREVQAQFNLHELAVEDALHAHQRAKVERYGDILFVVLRTARLEEGRIAFGETHTFLGKGFVVTVRHGASSSYSPVRARCEATPALLRHGEDFVLYALMDFVVDSYMPILDCLESEVERMEEQMLSRPPLDTEVERIHQVRRDLERLRRSASPLLDVCSRLERLDLPSIDEEIRPYFRDVHDHVIRVNEGIQSLREVLSFAFEASHMLSASRQNDVTRRLAAWAAILAVPTAVAGIYGMNFENMPELKWTWGYPMALGVIFSACTFLYWRFRRTGWL
jgi:magnesium transporter